MKTGPKPVPIDVRYEARVIRQPGCWGWRGALNKPGGYAYLGFGGRFGSPISVHRYAWERWRGPIPKGLCVLHECDNPPCSNPDHLFLGTLKDNVADMVAKGRDRFPFRESPPEQRGSRNTNAKLTEEAVREMRARRAGGEPLASLVDRFGVTKSHVSQIVRRKIWTHA